MSEHNGTLKYKDKSGNEYAWYPVTKLQNVIGLTNVLLNKQDVLTPGGGVIINDNVISIDAASFGGSIYTADDYYSFPVIGSNNTIYIDKGANKLYRWDEDDLRYYVVGSDYNDIGVVNGAF